MLYNYSSNIFFFATGFFFSKNMSFFSKTFVIKSGGSFFSKTPKNGKNNLTFFYHGNYSMFQKFRRGSAFRNSGVTEIQAWTTAGPKKAEEPRVGPGLKLFRPGLISESRAAPEFLKAGPHLNFWKPGRVWKFRPSSMLK